MTGAKVREDVVSSAFQRATELLSGAVAADDAQLAVKLRERADVAGSTVAGPR